MQKTFLKKGLILGVIVLLFGSVILPSINGDIGEIKESSNYFSNSFGDLSVDEGILDGYFIYNITKALSEIVFTEYNESAGELAKGRYFGSKGEHKAADILYENMSKLGLFTKKEQLGNLPSCPKITNHIEILDYGMTIHKGNISEKVDCYIDPAIFGPWGKPFDINYEFNFKGLKVRREHPKLWEKKEDYVLINTVKHYKMDDLLNSIFSGFPSFNLVIKVLRNMLRDIFEYIRYPHYKGRIHIDCNDNCHDMPASDTVIPRIYINGSVGKRINDSIDDYTVDFHLKQRVNKSVVSYNVIGQLNGTDPSKTVIIGCLYDGWFNQATADSAIGMGIVMGVAKYFDDKNITPKYNIKFIGFAGEEAGMRGSKYYEALHRNETIKYVIDLNQLGFDQAEQRRLTLQVAANRKIFLNDIWTVVERSNYKQRTGDTIDIEKVHMPFGHISDDFSFASKRPLQCKTVCFLKNGPWRLHHRDGVNHTEGDVLKYYNWTDVNVTAEIIWNVTEHLTVDLKGGQEDYSPVDLNFDDNLLFDIKR